MDWDVTWTALRSPCTVLRGKYESWSNVSVTLEEDSKRIMGADITMLERRSAAEIKPRRTKFWYKWNLHYWAWIKNMEKDNSWPMKWVTGEAVLVTNRFKTCSRISPLIGSCICAKKNPTKCVTYLQCLEHDLCITSGKTSVDNYTVPWSSQEELVHQVDTLAGLAF